MLKIKTNFKKFVDDARDFIVIVIILSLTPWSVWALNIGAGSLEHESFWLALYISVASIIILTVLYISDNIRASRERKAFQERLENEIKFRQRGSLRW